MNYTKVNSSLAFDFFEKQSKNQNLKMLGLFLDILIIGKNICNNQYIKYTN